MIRPTPRRRFAMLAASCLGVALLLPASPARAAAPEAFFHNFADQLVAIVNGPGDISTKRAALQPVIDRDVDVQTIARFCLGRFWSSASPAQQQKFVAVYHQVLLRNISGHLGDYQGVTYSIDGSTPQGGNVVVKTTINRPNVPPADVGWVVRPGGDPKVLDVLAEGTSLRLQQRDDYASYLSRHGGSVDALISALERQMSG
jgi:phospholipid transport system substrate-binding protein